LELKQKLDMLKKEKRAVVLAHNYQIDEVQEAADFIGDSFALSQIAAKTEADVILFCGVHFMAESAAILSPQKKVILPEKHAGCPMADMVTVDGLRELKRKYPDAAVVTYVNSSAEVKAESDICCTSSNAVKVVQSLPQDEIIFAPDRNLAHYVSRFTDKKIMPWQGFCNTHNKIRAEDVIKAKQAHPDAVVMVHPECRPEVVDLADEVASTSGMLEFASETPANKIIVGTEMGILYRLKRDNPGKTFYLLHQGLVCPNMKMTTLEKAVNALEKMEPIITVPDEIRVKAVRALDRMLEIK